MMARASRVLEGVDSGADARQRGGYRGQGTGYRVRTGGGHRERAFICKIRALCAWGGAFNRGTCTNVLKLPYRNGVSMSRQADHLQIERML